MSCLCSPALGFVCAQHRGADQDGYDGEEWITPQEDLEAQMIEAARVLLDAVEIEVAEGF